MSESTMRYDPENDIFFHKHEDGSWSAYFCERHESLRKTRSGHIEARSNQSEWPIQ